MPVFWVKYTHTRKQEEHPMTTETSEVRASHLLVDTEDEAKTLRQEIADGSKTFADAAGAVSKCPSGKNGGDLGFFGRGQMVKEFEEKSFTLPVGEVSEPFKTQFGWHLLVVTDRK